MDDGRAIRSQASGDQEFIAALADDIRKHGLKEPIVKFEGKILDGRNRMAACRMAEVEPKFKDFSGTRAEAVDHSWSENRHRRHLNSSQAAIADSKRLKIVEEYAGEVEKLKADAGKRKAQDSGKPRGEKKSHPQRIAGQNGKNDGEVRAHRAKSAGTNRQYVSDADRIVEERSRGNHHPTG